MSKTHISQQLVVEVWLTPQNDCMTQFAMGGLRYADPSYNWKCPKNIYFYFMEPYNDEIAWFSISRELPVAQSWLTPQNDCQKGFTMRVLRYVYPSYNWKCPLFLFFLGLWLWNFKSFHIMRTIYHIKWADLSKWSKDAPFH